MLRLVRKYRDWGRLYYLSARECFDRGNPAGAAVELVASAARLLDEGRWGSAARVLRVARRYADEAQPGLTGDAYYEYLQAKSVVGAMEVCAEERRTWKSNEASRRQPAHPEG